MLSIELKAFVDISDYWPIKPDGEKQAVYQVHKDLEDNHPEDLVNRHNLTRARDGLLEKGDFVNLVKLSRICSRWAGKTLSVSDLIKIKE
jgi:hypothetical protein